MCSESNVQVCFNTNSQIFATLCRYSFKLWKKFKTGLKEIADGFCASRKIGSRPKKVQIKWSRHLEISYIEISYIETCKASSVKERVRNTFR